MAHIFISYVRENTAGVQRLCDELHRHGLKTWIDREDIAPGARWKQAIRSGIRSGSIFIACFSKEYSDRDKTYMNEELTLAIEELRQRPTDKMWFIPVRLSQCQIPDRDIGAGETLRDVHCIDLESDWRGGITRIIEAVHARLPRCVFRRSRSRFRADDDQHSGTMAITIGAKRRWLVS